MEKQKKYIKLQKFIDILNTTNNGYFNFKRIRKTTNNFYKYGYLYYLCKKLTSEQVQILKNYDIEFCTSSPLYNPQQQITSILIFDYKRKKIKSADNIRLFCFLI